MFNTRHYSKGQTFFPSTNFPPKDLVFFYWLFHLNFLVFLRKLSRNKTFLFDIEMALLKAIVRNFLLRRSYSSSPSASDLFSVIISHFLLRRSYSSSPSASDLFSVIISHEQWINFISFNEMHLVLHLHPLNLKEKEVINGNGFECPLNWGSHILKPKTLKRARLWDEFDHKHKVWFQVLNGIYWI